MEIGRILAISYDMPPVLSPRSIQVNRLLSRWSESGIEVHVVCASAASSVENREDLIHGMVDSSGMHFHRVATPRGNRIDRIFAMMDGTGFFQRAARHIYALFRLLPDSRARWIDCALSVASDLIRHRDYSLLITFSNPVSDHLIGLRLRREVPISWIAHFSDPWIDDPYLRYRGLSRIWNAALERKVIGRADRLIFVCADTQELVMRKYPDSWKSKAFVVPQCFDRTAYPAPSDNRGNIVFRHLGSFFGMRTPEPLISALGRLRRENPHLLDGVVFEFIGECDQPARDLLSVHILKGVVRVVSLVPYRDSLRLMVDSDVLVLIDARDIDPNVFLPSKLIDYLGAKRPILGITPIRGPSADLIRKANGLIADPIHIEDVAEAVKVLIGEYRSGSLFPRRVPPEELVSKYEVSRVAADCRVIVEQLHGS